VRAAALAGVAEAFDRAEEQRQIQLAAVKEGAVPRGSVQIRTRSQAGSAARSTQHAPPMASITDAPPATWSADEIAAYQADYPADASYSLSFSKHNPTPGAQWGRGSSCLRLCPRPAQQLPLLQR